jgi:short-subunit dehydrogenase
MHTKHTTHVKRRINNAGTNAYKYGPLLDSSDEDLAAIVETNVLGVMRCCKEVRGRCAVRCVALCVRCLRACCV